MNLRLVLAAASIGMVAGFGLPLVSSFQTQRIYKPTIAQIPANSVLEIPSVAEAPRALVAAGSSEDASTVTHATTSKRVTTVHKRAHKGRRRRR